MDNILKNQLDWWEQTEKVKELESRVEGLEAKVEILKEVLLESKPKSFKFYSKEESDALLDALDTIPVGPQVMRTCLKLIELGWNDRFDQQRTASALRSKYLRLIGEK